MNLIIDFESFKVNDNGTVIGNIFFEFDGFFFPADSWCDFPVIIVNNWLNAITIDLVKFGECELLFMDGPYEIKIYQKSDDLESYYLDCIFRGKDDEILHSSSVIKQKLFNEFDKIEKFLEFFLVNYINNDDSVELRRKIINSKNKKRKLIN